MVPSKLAVYAATIAFLKDCRGFTTPTSNNNNNIPRYQSFGISNVNADTNHRISLLRVFDNGRAPASKTTIRNHRFAPTRSTTTQRRMGAVDNDEVAFLSDDPFVILGLDAPTADKKILKRAYKKRALKYHPDVVTDIHSNPEDKKKASDRFAKINGAYEQLMGKGGKGSKSTSTSDSNSNSNTSGGGYGYTPPHRRSNSGYSSSSSSYGDDSSTDWRDYMPNYRKEDDEKYDTGGDSFGQIFSDLFTGAAGAAVSGGIGGMGGGIFNEFLEFLEGGVGSGMGGGASGSGSDDDDAQLKVLLKTGTLEEVAEEMDDTELVVKQLERKSRTLEDEIFAADAEAKMAARFSERLEKEELGAELRARNEVVKGYLTRARKRLLVLQTRYKDLIAYGGQNDDYAASGGRNKGRGSTGSSWGDVREEATSSSRGSSGSSTTGTGTAGSTGRREPKSTTTSASGTTTNEDGNSEDAWMNEGFGSSGRSRGSGRRGSGRRRAAAASRSRASSAGVGSNPTPRSSPPPSPSPSSYSTSSTSTRSSTNQQPPSPGPRRTTTTPPSSSSSSSSSVVSNSKSNYSSDVPPHRRGTGSSFASRQQEDRQRMREVKVDEEFEKLKKELGL